MKMSSKFTISVQILMLVAIFEDEKITSEMMSQSTGANAVMIRQLFGKLKSANILNVSAGKGPTSLSQDPENISLWDIYIAVEEYNSNYLFKFHPKVSKDCQIGKFFTTVLETHLDDAIQEMANKLSTVSLSQLINEWESIENRNLQ